MERWSKERAWEWYNSRPWIRGCNYMSADCVNNALLSTDKGSFFLMMFAFGK